MSHNAVPSHLQLKRKHSKTQHRQCAEAHATYSRYNCYNKRSGVCREVTNDLHTHVQLIKIIGSNTHCIKVEVSWNVMAHAQKPDFVFRWNGRVHLNWRGRQFSRLLAAEVWISAFIVGSNTGCTMFWGSVKSTGYPLHLPVSPSLPLPCITVCHHISTGLYWLCITGMFRVTASKLNTGIRSVQNNQWWPRL